MDAVDERAWLAFCDSALAELVDEWVDQTVTVLDHVGKEELKASQWKRIAEAFRKWGTRQDSAGGVAELIEWCNSVQKRGGAKPEVKAFWNEVRRLFDVTHPKSMLREPLEAFLERHAGPLPEGKKERRRLLESWSNRAGPVLAEHVHARWSYLAMKKQEGGAG